MLEFVLLQGITQTQIVKATGYNPASVSQDVARMKKYYKKDDKAYREYCESKRKQITT